ncbi:hypothetical protein EK904_005622, partial [Melospiza melodia maxima]
MAETKLPGCPSDKSYLAVPVTKQLLAKTTRMDSALPPQVCAQLCRRPCYCPWVPPHCPRGSPLVLDGCGCCKVCARRLGEPCDFLHVCDQSQGLVCDYSSAPAGTAGTCNCEHRVSPFPGAGDASQVSFPAAPQRAQHLPPTPLSPVSCLAAPGAVSPLLRYPCPPWGTEWSPCSATCGLGFASRVSNQNRLCRLETQRRLCSAGPCPALPAALPA